MCVYVCLSIQPFDKIYAKARESAGVANLCQMKFRQMKFRQIKNKICQKKKNVVPKKKFRQKRTIKKFCHKRKKTKFCQKR